MTPLTTLLFIMPSFLYLCSAQTAANYTELESTCFDNVKLTSCKEMDAKSLQCGAIDPNDQASLIACTCTQDMFSLYIECRDELRACSKSTTGDASINDIITSWHTACDNKLSASVNTPSAATSFTATNPDSCLNIASACDGWVQGSSACTTTTNFNGCICQTNMMSLASVCEVDGNKTCAGIDGSVKRLWEWEHCAGAKNFFTKTDEYSPATTSPRSVGGSSSGSLSLFIPSQTAASTTTSTSQAGISARFSAALFFICIGAIMGVWLAT